MAKENDGQALRDYGKRRRRYRRNKTIIIISFLLIIAMVGAVYLIRLYNRTYQNYKVVNSTTNTEENLAGYLKYGESVVRYSKDGAIAFDKDGNQLWNGSYEMQDPIVDNSGNFVVVADRGYKSVHIFNEKGETGSFETEYKITKAEVASHGVVAILMEEKKVTYIRFYDKEGNLIDITMDLNVNKDGYPMDISLSQDGKKLAVIFVSVNTGKIVNKVAFYNFGEVGKNYVDHLAGAYIYEDLVIPRITFLNNDVACAYKDNGFILYSIPELSDLIADKTTDKKIKSILHSKNYTGLILEGNDTASSQLLLYNLKGEKILDKKLTFDYDKIYISGEEIIMYNDLSCMVLKTNGRVKFKYTFNSNISAFYPINYLDRYFLINADKISQIQLLE